MYSLEKKGPYTQLRETRVRTNFSRESQLAPVALPESVHARPWYPDDHVCAPFVVVESLQDGKKRRTTNWDTQWGTRMFRSPHFEFAYLVTPPDGLGAHTYLSDSVCAASLTLVRSWNI
jgi:hypothetical protein